MRVFIAVLIVSRILSASSLFDFSYLSDAKEAYTQKEYAKAEKLYQKVEGDASTFNQADSLYMQKKYKEALDIYESISDEKLAFKRLHNMGNSYAQLGKIDKAIASYENALKIQEDEDTKFNLELLKKKKKEQEKQKKDNKKQDDKKQDDKNKDSKDKKDKESKDKQEQKEKEKKKEEDKQKKQEDKERQPQESNQTKPQPPISNMEERKWQKMLNQKGVNTLMLPLNNKGEDSDKKNPW